MIEWHDGPPPEADDGSTVLVILKRRADKNWLSEDGLEYYGEPIVVGRWSSKLKTTVEPIRIEYDDVLK